jgi:hypothetical protein
MPTLTLKRFESFKDSQEVISIRYQKDGERKQYSGVVTEVALSKKNKPFIKLELEGNSGFRTLHVDKMICID